MYLSQYFYCICICVKVEFILFECLQDLTGGTPIFNLAITSYIADVSSIESRTARLCFVAAVTSFGFMVGLFDSVFVKLNKNINK